MTIIYNLEKTHENIDNFVYALQSAVMDYSLDFVDEIPENFRGKVPRFNTGLWALIFGSEGKIPVRKMIGSNLCWGSYAAKIEFYSPEYYENPEYSGFKRVLHAIKEYFAPKPEIPPPPNYLCGVTVHSDANTIEFEAGSVEASEENLARLVDKAFKLMIQKPVIVFTGNSTVS